MSKSRWDAKKGKHFPYMENVWLPETGKLISTNATKSTLIQILDPPAIQILDPPECVPDPSEWVKATQSLKMDYPVTYSTLATITYRFAVEDPTVEEILEEFEEEEMILVAFRAVPHIEDLMASKIAAKQKAKPKKSVPKSPPIFQWTFVSAHETHGVRAVYTTLLREDKNLTCNCPRWIFKKSGQDERSCKHTVSVKEEAIKHHKTWRGGGELPTFENPTFGGSETLNLKPSLAYGRVIEMD